MCVPYSWLYVCLTLGCMRAYVLVFVPLLCVFTSTYICAPEDATRLLCILKLQTLFLNQARYTHAQSSLKLAAEMPAGNVMQQCMSIVLFTGRRNVSG